MGVDAARCLVIEDSLIVFGILSLCSDRVFGNDSTRADSCSAVWHSSRSECSGTILLRQNRARPFGTLLGQSVRERFCLGRTVFGRLALCSGRVFRNDSARAEPCSTVWHSTRVECSGTILLGQNRARPFATLLGQSVRERFCSGRLVFGRLALCSGRVFGNDSALAEPCSAVCHSARAEGSGTILLGQNRARWDFKSTTSTTFILEPLPPSSSLPPQPSTSQPSPSLPAKNALGDVKDQAEDEANPRPWYTADEKSSKMSIEDLVELLWEYPLLVGWYARLPGLQEPSNYGTKYETGIYEGQVKSGYRLPLYPFALRFFEHYHMAPGQLVPNGWRKLVELIYLVQTLGYKPDATDFMRVFFEICFVKGVANCPGWYYIHKKLPFDREWNPYCKDFENPGKPAPNNLTKHILSHIKLWGGFSIDEPLSQQQLEWARIIPRMPIPAGAITPPSAPTISSTFPAESAPLGKAKGKRKEKQPSAELPPAPKKTRMYASGSEMLSRFEMARQVAAEEAQQKKEAIKEAEEATRRAEELSKQETDYLAQIETLERRLERAKRRVAEEVKKARDQGIRDFLDGNAGDELFKKRADDGLEIYELGFAKAKEMFAEHFPHISLDDFVLPAMISPSGKTV
ncbi:hypothetical protein RJ639_021975 [Escallonia herrerae]|uniref:Transposase (putative) gypsy type domain-containing protein n=1 Tax=Escallonia herrerae TaxID=1293975 RepID=A0AA89AGD4_9ASTE|nr:hypothetical protein RJ639_021975 [Escallonia herrerae]